MGRAWYLFSCDHDIIKIRPEFLQQKDNIFHVVQPTMHSTLGVYDICPLKASTCMCSKLPFTVFPVSRFTVKSFYSQSTFDAVHIRKNTRLSSPAQLQCSVCTIFAHPKSSLSSFSCSEQVFLLPFYPWWCSHEKKYQALPTCTTSMFMFWSARAWKQGYHLPLPGPYLLLLLMSTALKILKPKLWDPIVCTILMVWEWD